MASSEFATAVPGALGLAGTVVAVPGAELDAGLQPTEFRPMQMRRAMVLMALGFIECALCDAPTLPNGNYEARIYLAALNPNLRSRSGAAGG